MSGAAAEMPVKGKYESRCVVESLLVDKTISIEAKSLDKWLRRNVYEELKRFFCRNWSRIGF